MTYDAVTTPDQTTTEPASPTARGRSRASGKPKPSNRKTPARPTPWQQILTRATETFGTEERASAWLKRPAAPLQDQTPQSVIATPEGFRQVEQLLGQIDHGIAA